MSLICKQTTVVGGSNQIFVGVKSRHDMYFLAIKSHLALTELHCDYAWKVASQTWNVEEE